MFGVLNVYLKDRYVGQLSYESERDVYAFRYDTGYLADPKAEPLSFALPLRAEPFDADRSYNYFANLLPPVVVRKKLEKCIHVSKNNVYGFLKAIGGDCAGAVALYVPGSKPEDRSQQTYRPLTETEAVEILKSLRRRPLYAAGELGYRYSGAGAQDKLVASLREGHLLLPLFGAPSSHIVKPPAADFEDSVENEHFCQRLAAAAGVRAAETSILTLGGERYYVTKRFDREPDESGYRRLHQEDFCQMLSVDPEVKYEEDGGPTAVQCIKTLRALHATVSETVAFVDMLIFNCLVGNADAHAKNYSVVYYGGRPMLAPLYDAVSTAVYPELSTDYAMSIGGDRAFDSLSRESFARFAREAGIAPAFVLGRLDALASRLLPTAEMLADELKASYPSPVYAKVIAFVTDCLHRLRFAS